MSNVGHFDVKVTSLKIIHLFTCLFAYGKVEHGVASFSEWKLALLTQAFYSHGTISFLLIKSSILGFSFTWVLLSNQTCGRMYGRLCFPVCVCISVWVPGYVVVSLDVSRFYV